MNLNKILKDKNVFYCFICIFATENNTMKISKETKISNILKHNKEAIEVLVSLNSNFKKLNNPVLRKVLASRVNIQQASKIAKCSADEMIEALLKIGFELERESIKTTNKKVMEETRFDISEAIVLDVRSEIAGGNDPFSIIMEAVKKLEDKQVIKIINVFEPIPLIHKLSQDGFQYFIDREGEDLVNTYFKKVGKIDISDIEHDFSTEGDFNKVKNFFGDRLIEIDVRDLEMPEPMVKILQNIENLKEGDALFVNHKKVPQYLLPELDSKGLKYLIRELDNDNVKLLIFI